MKVENEAGTPHRTSVIRGVEANPSPEADVGSAYPAAANVVQSSPSRPTEAHTLHEPLLMHNLLNDLPTLGSVFLTEARRGSWLNAYLLAAGMNQIIEDYLHPDPYYLNKVAGHVAHMRAPVGRLGAGTARSFATVLSFLRGRQGAAQDISRRQAELAALVQQLADLVACPTATTRASREMLLALAETFVASLEQFPRSLLREVLRLPSCFRSFDQQPADLERITLEFTQRMPDRGRPLLVVGMRSSGSYLAPLHGAFLKAQGYLDVRVITLRPGRWLWPREHALLKSVIRRRGLVLFTDDPPVSGATLAEAAESLEHMGVPARSIIMLLQLFGSRDVPPPRLNRYKCVVLPWQDWAIHTLLAPSAVLSALADLLAPARTVLTVKRRPLPPRQWERGHADALYEVEFVERAGGGRQQQHVYVRGAGLGYFGEHALAIGRALGPFLPEVYGLRAGLLYREWLPDEQRINPYEPGAAVEQAEAMITYVEARRHALRVKEDVSLRLTGRLPAWEVASNLLSQAFGRGWLFARMPIVDPIVKRLLHCTDPSVIDGSMTPVHWFAAEGEGHRLLKVDFSERAFSNRDLYCYDPAFDVAGMAASVDLTEASADGRGGGLPGALRVTYENRTARISAERWLLYQLVHLSSLRTMQPGERPEVRRALSRALQRYFDEIFFHDLSVPTVGALCALDIDGVLETGPLGFSGLTAAGAATIRALILHGFRPVLATGRSLDEVRERCSAYHLAGGVAEYGAVVYNHGTGSVRQLLSNDDRHDLDRLRASLGEIAGVYIDRDYRHAVRAYRLDSKGKRRGLSPEAATAATAAGGVERRVRPIVGQAQTDFMVNHIDKGTGLRALVAELDARSPDAGDGKPLAFAVGDTFSDLPMFKLAGMAFAPANADDQVRNSDVEVLKRPYQAGLALAATRLLGHAPGRCRVCRGVPVSRDTSIFLAVLAVQEAGTWGILRRALQLATCVWRT